MKRSELVSKIKEYLSNFENDGFDEELEDDADSLLYMIEKAGMLPPGYLKPIPFESDGRQYPLVPGDFKNDASIWCTPGINEWEPENV